MANFKIASLEAKFGMTVEVNKRWIRVDRGIVMDNLNPDEEVLVKEIRGAYDKCQALLLEEVDKALKSVNKGDK